MTLAEAVQFLVDAHPGVTALVLFASALVEYVFPPFPGDTVTLAGAVLVGAWGYSLPLTLAAVVLGGLAGAAIDFEVGRLLARGHGSRLMRFALVRQAVGGMERVSRAFARHGEAFIAINRFLPGIRAFLFIAAGIAGMRRGRVLFFATLSGLAWNALIIVVGLGVGANLDLLETMFHDYSIVVWSLLGVAAIGFAGRWAWLRRKPRA